MQTDDSRRQFFQLAVEQLADSTYRVAYRLLGHHELARELVQETYLAAWKNLSQLQDLSRLKSWLMGILRNQYTKQLTRERRHQHEALTIDPPIKNQGHDSSDAVEEALAQLDEDQRLPILLVTMESWSVDEVAEMLSVPRGTVLSRLHRARQRLKTILLPDWDI
jgi:RNA polymerase sigma-70 factor (ECF subfamily)